MYKFGAFCLILGEGMLAVFAIGAVVGIVAGNSPAEAFGKDGFLATMLLFGGLIMAAVGWALKKAALEEPPR